MPVRKLKILVRGTNVIRIKMAEINEMLKDMLPYGGAVNIYGEITWRVTEEEFNEMKRHLESIFDESH
jgi:hypothetical protein